MKKKLIYLLIPALIGMNFISCCECMNCPGFGQVSGTGSDSICKDDYEASNQNMSWASYTDVMLQSGCKCIK